MKHPTIDALYAAYNAHSIGDVRRLYADDAVHDDVPIGHPRHGAEEISEGLGRFFEWFPDANWQVSDLIVGDAVVASTYVLTASLQSEFHGIPARGQTIRLRGVHVLHLRDGLIERSEDYWDAKTFEKQIKMHNKELEA